MPVNAHFYVFVPIFTGFDSFVNNASFVSPPFYFSYLAIFQKNAKILSLSETFSTTFVNKLYEGRHEHPPIELNFILTLNYRQYYGKNYWY